MNLGVTATLLGNDDPAPHHDGVDLCRVWLLVERATLDERVWPSPVRQQVATGDWARWHTSYHVALTASADNPHLTRVVAETLRALEPYLREALDEDDIAVLNERMVRLTTARVAGLVKESTLLLDAHVEHIERVITERYATTRRHP